MAYIKVPEQFQKELEEAPEAGMGYHNTEITLMDNTVVKKPIVNCKYIVITTEDIFTEEDIKSIKVI